MRSVSFFNKEQAAEYEPLRKLISLDSLNIEDYISPFKELINSTCLDEILGKALSDLPGLREQLDASTEDDDWRLLLTERFSLRVRKLPNFSLKQWDPRTNKAQSLAGQTLVSLPNDILFGMMGRGFIGTQLYRSAFDRDPEVFTKDHRIVPVGRRRFVHGEHVLLRACEDVMDFEESEGDMVTVDLSTITANPIVWNYDRSTLQACYSNSGSVDANRTEMAIEFLRLFNATSSVPNLMLVAREHSHHWVRWKAVQTMLQLDLTEGLAGLETALNDKHKHVRNAAQATLDKLRAAHMVA